MTLKYIAWKHDSNCYDRLLYYYNENNTTFFRERAKEFEEYPKDVEERGFMIQEYRG